MKSFKVIKQLKTKNIPWSISNYKKYIFISDHSGSIHIYNILTGSHLLSEKVIEYGINFIQLLSTNEFALGSIQGLFFMKFH